MDPWSGGHTIILDCKRAAEEGTALVHDYKTEGGRYQVLCNAHSTIVYCTAVPDARGCMKDPTAFCHECRCIAGEVPCGDPDCNHHATAPRTAEQRKRYAAKAIRQATAFGQHAVYAECRDGQRRRITTARTIKGGFGCLLQGRAMDGEWHELRGVDSYEIH